MNTCINVFRLLDVLIFHIHNDSVKILYMFWTQIPVYAWVYNKRDNYKTQGYKHENNYLKSMYIVVLGGIIFLLPVYGITNSERYSVFHGI